MKRKMVKGIGIAMAAAMAMTGCMPVFAEATEAAATEAAAESETAQKVEQVEQTIEATEAPEVLEDETRKETYSFKRPRTIITTDGEIDDQCSLVRYMLYANMFELDGLISSSSKFHYTDKEDEVFKGKTSNQKWIDAYAKVYDNLKKHEEGFPTPEYLTSINLQGNIQYPGEMDLDTEGSMQIKKCILDDRTDPLYIQVWGGTNTLAAALRSIEQEYKDTDQWEDIYKKVCDKVRVWIDLDQDDTYNNYIRVNWPDISVVMSYTQFFALAYPWQWLMPEEYHPYFSTPFMKEHIANDSNPLSEIYYNNLISKEASGFKPDEEHRFDFLSEGDTPNFFYMLDNGLRSEENPSWGGWAGRFYHVNGGLGPDAARMGGLWIDVADDGDHFKPLYRWADDFQNEFAARMQWCTEDYENANHDPVITLEEGVDLTAKRGDTVTLTADTSDPDGDNVTVTFWQYGDADTYAGTVDLTVDGNKATFTVPEDAMIGSTIHIIAEAQDDAELPITRYQRAVITVVEEVPEESATE